MPEQPARENNSPDQRRKWLVQLQEDFTAVARHGSIQIRLIHIATNAEAQGVYDWPELEGALAFIGLGERELTLNTDANGQPRALDGPPVLTPDGHPVLNQAGQPVDVTMPASRTVFVKGDDEHAEHLRSLAVRGGRLAIDMRTALLGRLAGWRFSRDHRDEAVWWTLLFEVAWAKEHELLTARRMIWTQPNLRLPYDREQLRSIASSFEAFRKRGKGPETHPLDAPLFPAPWLDRLPDAYCSDINDAAPACACLAEALLAELGTDADEPDIDDTESAAPEKTRGQRGTSEADAAQAGRGESPESPNAGKRDNPSNLPPSRRNALAAYERAVEEREEIAELPRPELLGAVTEALQSVAERLPDEKAQVFEELLRQLPASPLTFATYLRAAGVVIRGTRADRQRSFPNRDQT